MKNAIYVCVCIIYQPITHSSAYFHAQPCCGSRLGAMTDFAVRPHQRHNQPIKGWIQALARMLHHSGKAPPPRKLRHPNTPGGRGEGSQQAIEHQGRNQRHAYTLCLLRLVLFNPSHTAQHIFMRSRAVDLDWAPVDRLRCQATLKAQPAN